MKKNTFIFFGFFLALGMTISCKPRIQTSPTEIIDYSGGDNNISYEQSEDNRWAKSCNEDFCIEFLFDELFDGFDKSIQYTLTLTAKKDIANIKVHEYWYWKEFLLVENISAPKNAILDPRTSNHEFMVWQLDCEKDSVYVFINRMVISDDNMLIKHYSNTIWYYLNAGVGFDWPIGVSRSLKFDENGKELNASQVATLRATHNWNKKYTPVFFTGTPIPRNIPRTTPTPERNATPTPYPIATYSIPTNPGDRLYP